MTKFFIILLLLSALAVGDVSIDMQINRIKNAPAAERVKLMNAFKQRVSQMNHEDRSVAINAIRAKISSRVQESRQNMRERKREDVKEHISQMQQQESDDTTAYQTMNQQQIKNLSSREKMEKEDGRVSQYKMDDAVIKVIQENIKQRPQIEEQRREPNQQINKEKIEQNIQVNQPINQEKIGQSIKVEVEQVEQTFHTKDTYTINIESR